MPPKSRRFPPVAACGLLLAAVTIALSHPSNAATPRGVLARVSADGHTRRDTLTEGTALLRNVSGQRVELTQVGGPGATLRVLVEFDVPPVSRAAGAQAFGPSSRLAQLRGDLAALAASAAPNVQDRAAAARVPTGRVTQGYARVFSGAAVTLSAELLDGLRRLPYVRRVVPDDTVRATLVESVPLIRADSLRAMTGASGAGIRVGIVDTGVDYHHAALGGGFGPGFKVAGGWDSVNGDADPADDHGHGTHVAGIVAGDGAGVQGVAPGATLYAFKVLAAAGYGYTSWILDGLERALDPDGDPGTDDAMDVVNLSLGSPGGHPDDVLSLALDHLTDAGVVCCVAAGNDGGYWTIGSPGTSRKAITVGSTDKQDSLSWFTSLGPVPHTYELKPDLFAPGGGIVSSAMGGGTIALSGTSMATPHVAGAAALLLQRHPEWTPADVKSALAATAIDLDRDPFRQGSGRIDLLRADASRLTLSPIHVSFGRVPLSPPTWSRTDTVRVTNHGEASRTFTLPASLTIAPGAVVHVSPVSLNLAPGATGLVFVTLDVDNAALTDPAGGPNGLAATLVGTCDSREYRLPVTFHQHAVLQVLTSGAVNVMVVENHDTRQLHLASFYQPEVRVPPGTYDVTMAFYPLHTFVTRQSITVVEDATVTIEPEDAVYHQTFAQVDASGAAVVSDAGSVQLSREGSSWSVGFAGFPVVDIATNALPADYLLDYSVGSTDYRTRWASFPGRLQGVDASHVFTNRTEDVKHFTVDIPASTLPSTAPLFYTYFPNPPEIGGYYGFGFYDGVPETTAFRMSFDIVPSVVTNHYELGVGLELWAIANGTISWADPPAQLGPYLRFDRGWPIESHLGVMLFEPSARFGGTHMAIGSGLPVWRGVFHNYADAIALDEGGTFYAPHLWTDSYGTVFDEPDGPFSLSRAGTIEETGVATGTGGFTHWGTWEHLLPGPGVWDFSMTRDGVRNGSPSHFTMSAHLDSEHPFDPNPPSLRSFQVRANGQEAEAIDFATAAAPEVRFRTSDEDLAIPSVWVRRDLEGENAWIELGALRDGAEWRTPLPATLDGPISVRLVLADPSGQTATHTWTPAFEASPGSATSAPPRAGVAGLALAGAWPNPARTHDLRLRLTLPSSDPAKLELLDLAGRVVARRDVGALGAGEHLVRIEPAAPLRPGVFFARLSQGGASRTARICLVQ